MRQTNNFDLSRLWLLLKMECFRIRNGLFLTFAAAFGLLFIGDLTSPIFKKEPSSAHEEDYAFMLIVLGFILSSLAFQDLKNGLRRYQYLTLPASSFEKFLSMWLLTSLGWVFAFTLVYVPYTWFSNNICSLIYRHNAYPAFDLFSEIPLASIRCYFVLQSIFLVGAVQFRGYAFLKTLLVLLIGGIVLGIIAYYTLSGLFEGTEHCLTDACMWENTGIYRYWMLLKGLFWCALAPTCWTITYLGLKEQEVWDGIQ